MSFVIVHPLDLQLYPFDPPLNPRLLKAPRFFPWTRRKPALRIAALQEQTFQFTRHGVQTLFLTGMRIPFFLPRLFQESRNILHKPFRKLVIRLLENHQVHIQIMILQEGSNGIHRHLKCFLFRISVGSGRNQWKGDGLQTILHRQCQRFSIARG